MKAPNEGESAPFGLILLFFKSQFLSRQRERPAVPEPQGGYGIVTSFLDCLDGIEVWLHEP